MPTGDTAAAVAFLSAWHRDRLRVVTAITPAKGGAFSATFAPGQEEAMAQWIEVRQGSANLYFTPNLVEKNFKGFTKPKGDPDDLKLIQGVTPELEKKLNKLGLIKFEQIANLSDDEIARLDEELQLNGAIERDDWVGKATDLMAETTVEEVPAEEEEGGEGEAETAEAAAEPKAEKAAKAKREKPAKQPKKS